MPLTDRQTLSQLAKNPMHGDFSKTFQRLFKHAHFRCHTSALKLFLTQDNKVCRVAYALEESDGATLAMRFKEMLDYVNIDERVSMEKI
jgi:hypothetical protein